MSKKPVHEYRSITGVRARNEWGRFCQPESPQAVDYDFQYAGDEPEEEFEDDDDDDDYAEDDDDDDREE